MAPKQRGREALGPAFTVVASTLYVLTFMVLGIVDSMRGGEADYRMVGFVCLGGELRKGMIRGHEQGS